MTPFQKLQHRHLIQVLGPVLFAAISGCATEEITVCYGIDEDSPAGSCEEDLEAAGDLLPLETCTSPIYRVVEIVEFSGQEEGSVNDLGPDSGDSCCYLAKGRPLNGQSCVVGRALVSDQGASLASLGVDRGWIDGGEASPSRSRIAGPTPHPNPPPQGVREEDGRAQQALGAMWGRTALAEHASVASFARAAMELMAHGAPASLVDGHLKAARDEVRHATAAFALASTFVGNPVGPGRLPVTAREVPDLAALAAEVTREGCVNETLAACLAAAQRVGATDASVIAALDEVIRDESAHAALAWETLAWLIGEGGEPVRAAAAEALESALAGVPDLGLFAVEVESAETVRHGGLGERSLQRAAVRVLREVVAPTARALVG